MRYFREAVDMQPATSSTQATVAELAGFRAAAYTSRDRYETMRLQAQALQALGYLGVPEAAEATVQDQLSNSVDPLVMCSAIRALRGFSKPQPWAAAPLLRLLVAPPEDAPFSIILPKGTEVTTLRLEAVRAVRGGWVPDPEVIHLLRSIVEQEKNAAEGPLAQQLRREAGEVLSFLERCPCERPPVPPTLALKPTSGRTQSAIKELALHDSGTSPTRFASIIGKPAVVVFFYTRCDNPNRCSRALAWLRQLQVALREADKEKQVELLGITFEPALDTPSRLAEFASMHQLEIGEHCHLLAPATEDLRKLAAALAVPVSFDGPHVGTHGCAVYLLDAKGRLAWNTDGDLPSTTDLIPALSALLAESPGSP